MITIKLRDKPNSKVEPAVFKREGEMFQGITCMSCTFNSSVQIFCYHCEIIIGFQQEYVYMRGYLLHRLRFLFL